MSKRGASIYDDDDELESISNKRSRPNTEEQSTALITSIKSQHSSLILRDTTKNQRVSSLSAPEISLAGHDGAVYSVAFDPDGKNLCSGSMDRQIFLWNIENECKNYNVLRGHKNAVLQVQWPSPNTVLSCSADKTVALWDSHRGTRIRKLTEHTGIVNSCAVARDEPSLFASGSDDCTAILWDVRSKQSLATVYHDYQVCAVALSHEGNYLFTAGIDNIIRRYDTRVGDLTTPDLVLEGHDDTVTGLAMSPDNNRLLSNSMDSTLRIWNVRPYHHSQSSSDSNGRCEHILQGVHHGAEKLLLKCAWSYDGEYVSAGSADRLVHMWETSTGMYVSAWPGHKASVNQVAFHPREPIMVSASSDRSIVLGEYAL